MSEFWHLSRSMRAAGAALLLSSCLSGCADNDPEAPKKMPNIQAPAVLSALGGRSMVSAIAFGIGLTVGCNPDQHLDNDGDLKGDAKAAYEKARKSNEAEAEDGFSDGWQLGQTESANPASEVC